MKYFYLLIVALIFKTLSVATPVVTWDFTQGSLVDSTASQILTAYGNPDRIRWVDGVLQFDNLDYAKADSGILVLQDLPILTGHDNSAKGYESLVIQADVWIDVLGRQMQIVRKTDDADLGYQLYVTADGKAGFKIKTDEGSRVLNSKNRLEPGRWHRIEAVWDSHVNTYNCHIVLDGVVTWGSCQLVRLDDTQSPLVVGGFFRDKNNIGQVFSGKIRNLAVSVNRPDLLEVPGKIDLTPIRPTGQHLLSQPGLLSNDFICNPPVTPECHASTISQTKDGRLVAAWFGGTREGHVDSAVWFAEHDGSVWGPPRSIAHGTYDDGSPSATFNPVLYQSPHDGLMLFFLGGYLSSANGNLMYSQDGGHTWTQPRRLPKGIRGATKNPPVLNNEGLLICPDNGSTMKFDLTSDFGQTWHPSVRCQREELTAIQPTILNHGLGQFQALGRSKSGMIAESWSVDNGQTWSRLERTSLPNNYSGFCGTTMADGRHLLVYNHVGIPEGKWGGPRSPLNVAVSNDGINWDAVLVLEDERGEFSYPTVIQSNDGKVHVTYTWNRTRIKHAVLDPDDFKPKPIVGGIWPNAD